jgi:hypothetical protein
VLFGKLPYARGGRRNTEVGSFFGRFDANFASDKVVG